MATSASCRLCKELSTEKTPGQQQRWRYGSYQTVGLVKQLSYASSGLADCSSGPVVEFCVLDVSLLSLRFYSAFGNRACHASKIPVKGLLDGPTCSGNGSEQASATSVSVDFLNAIDFW